MTSGRPGAGPEPPSPESSAARVGVYPGSFNPPTTAHLAIAEAALTHHRLDRLDLCVSTLALAKEHVAHPRFDHRVEVLHLATADIDWLGVRITEHRLLADIATGYQLLVVGADKWFQIQDPVWYQDDIAARDAAIDGLPPVAIAPRDGLATPAPLTLPVTPAAIDGVSSSEARAGNLGLMVPAARTFAERTGAWIEPERYDRWLADQGR